jgi:diguanylate cyclase (GGDEF)-like protein
MNTGFCTRGRAVRGARWVCGLLWAGAVSLWAHAQTPAPVASAVQAQAWAQQLDRLVRLADDGAVAASRTLAELAPPTEAGAHRLLALARAEVQVRTGNPALAGAAVAAVQPLSQALSADLATGDRLFLQALSAERSGTADPDPLAREALVAYQRHCDARAPGQAACEYRPRWRMHHLLSLRAGTHRDENGQRRQAEAALALAVAGGDALRQSWSHSHLALLRGADPSGSVWHLAQAVKQAELAGDAGMLGRARMVASAHLQDAGDLVGAEAALREALALARQGQAARLETLVQGNLSHLALMRREPARALVAEAGLEIARRLADRRVERLLMHNAMLAQVALGRTAAAVVTQQALQAAWAAEGNTGAQVMALREFSDALAAAGDLPAALKAYHQERELNQALSARSQAMALADLRQRNDREAQQRNIVKLERDNALKQAELDNQGLLRRVWGLAALALVLALAVVGLLLLRVRETNRQLAANQARLKLQSERDPLTGLANRRHLHSVLQDATDAQLGYQGGVLMVDIDHFKAINDGHGHEAGDAVLVEVARRIASSLREGDTVARWGGEEFLVHAPGLQTAEAQGLVQRLLQAVAGSPVVLPGGGLLRATVSIGHACFPLQPHRVPAQAEQAINLADMALYEAKGRGRNRAIGLLHCQAADAAGLAALEADFERACSEGRVVVDTQLGP